MKAHDEITELNTMLKILERKNFDEAYRLMELSFPEDERRTYREQKELLTNPLYRIYVPEGSPDGRLQAFAAVWEFDTIAFIEHLAVDPAYRNHGIGAKILNEVAERAGKPLCLEVEPPNHEMASRRIEFYKRNHFFFNDYHYIQPSISKGRKAIPLFLMTSERNVTKTEFETIRDILYQHVYRVQTEPKDIG